jgi:hypothetical protein
MKKLLGRTELEDALKRLNKLTDEEARVAIAQNLNATTLDASVLSVDQRLEVVNAGKAKVLSQSSTVITYDAHRRKRRKTLANRPTRSQ